jgi:hypothetical protein
MNILRLVKRPSPVSTGTSSCDSRQPRPSHRDRDFGIGYGTSSGYGQDRRYAGNAPRPMFRCS